MNSKKGTTPAMCISKARLKRIHADFVQFRENNSDLLSKRNAALEELYVVKMAAAQIGLKSSGRSQPCACDGRHVVSVRCDRARAKTVTYFLS